jgi:hypothetical protein
VEAILLGKGAWQQWLLTLKAADPKCNDDLFACGSLPILPLLRLTDSSTSAGGSESARKKPWEERLLTVKSADPKCNNDLSACGSLLILPFCDLPIPRPQQVEASLLGKSHGKSGF